VLLQQYFKGQVLLQQYFKGQGLGLDVSSGSAHELEQAVFTAVEGKLAELSKAGEVTLADLQLFRSGKFTWQVRLEQLSTACNHDSHGITSLYFWCESSPQLWARRQQLHQSESAQSLLRCCTVPCKWGAC
jgi:hypothetical protein